MTLRPGEIVLENASRSFSVRADQAATLKSLLLGARAAGPPPVPALRGVTLRIEPGETVGIVGRNGAGKTSTLRVLAGIVPLQAGRAACGGRVVSLLELGAGFGREFSGRENIYLQGALYGFTRSQIEERVEQIIAFSELGEFIEVPVKTYSAGMFVRLGFSIAAHLNSDVLLIDEVLAVGDEAFQRKCHRRIAERIAAGTTVVFVSHDAAAVERICERVVVLDAGKVVFDGATAEGLLHYHRLMGTEHGGGELLRSSPDERLEIADLELRDGEDRATAVFHSGAAFQAVIAVKVRPGREHALALELRSQDGTLLYRDSHCFEPAEDGSALLVYSVPELWLLRGDYDLSIGAPDASPSRTVRFSVLQAPGAEGVIDLRGSWRALTAAGELR